MAPSTAQATRTNLRVVDLDDVLAELDHMTHEERVELVWSQPLRTTRPAVALSNCAWD
jgi:hypothetical protein